MSIDNGPAEPVSPKPPCDHRQPVVRLNTLPDDVLLRVVTQAGEVSQQIGIAYSLAAVCSRFHHLLHALFLPTVSQLSSNSLSALSLSDPLRAREGLAAFFTSTTGLRELSLPGCSPSLLSAECMRALARSCCASLTRVNLAHCRISDAVLAPLLQCGRLRVVNLVSADGPTGSTFHKSQCRAPIESLDISWVASITEEGVLAIGTLGSVTKLWLTGCDAVGSMTLIGLSQMEIRRSLISLALSYCPVRAEALFALLQRAAKLESLSLSAFACNIWEVGDYTQESINNLRALFPLVDIHSRTCG